MKVKYRIKSAKFPRTFGDYCRCFNPLFSQFRSILTAFATFGKDFSGPFIRANFSLVITNLFLPRLLFESRIS